MSLHYYTRPSAQYIWKLCVLMQKMLFQKSTVQWCWWSQAKRNASCCAVHNKYEWAFDTESTK